MNKADEPSVNRNKKREMRAITPQLRRFKGTLIRKLQGVCPGPSKTL
jgi:hypothetical protein